MVSLAGLSPGSGESGISDTGTGDLVFGAESPKWLPRTVTVFHRETWGRRVCYTSFSVPTLKPSACWYVNHRQNRTRKPVLFMLCAACCLLASQNNEDGKEHGPTKGQGYWHSSQVLDNV